MYIDFLSTLHKSTKRDYLARVNDKEFPKYKAATLAKKWGYHYWDGSRKINYGGYKYIKGRWFSVIKKMIKRYKLNNNSKILDIGCGKGFFLSDIKVLLPGIKAYGLDKSKYAISKAQKSIKSNLKYGCASKLPWNNKFFDLVISINTLHNLEINRLFSAIQEINRVSKKSYICVESYRNEIEKQNLLYWQVTCEAFFNTNEWKWIFKKNYFKGDHSFIYFN
tara:strand:+ start:277 stop:942 length:666 start_codon:yes stop_codon:yes gene_type:complete